MNIISVFGHPSIKSVIFEWAGVNDNCPADDFKKVLDLMRQNGLKLYRQHQYPQGKFEDASNVPDDELLMAKGVNLFWSKISP